MDNNVEAYMFSLDQFRSLIESDKNKLSNEDHIKEQKRLLEAAGINQDLNNKKIKDIRLKCDYLGKQGWAICPFWCPLKNESWYDTWFWQEYHNQSDKIAAYFTENDYFLLGNINGFSRFEVDRYDWFEEAEDLFANHHYNSCAMLLTAILEQSIRKCPVKDWRKNVDVFFNELIYVEIKDYYRKNLEPLNKYIETILLLPSVNGFISSYYDKGHGFWKDKEGKLKKEEPQFIVRNWLMHGMTKRTITEIDCIKLFNAICGVCYITIKLFNPLTEAVDP